jgi:hypothetical protein
MGGERISKCNMCASQPDLVVIMLCSCSICHEWELKLLVIYKGLLGHRIDLPNLMVIQ